MINRLCVVGVGLIGGSLALALKKAGFCQHVVGAGRNQQRLQQTVDAGVIDSYELDYAKAVADAEVVFVSVPLGSMADVFIKMQPGLGNDTVVTDGGSAKYRVIEDAAKSTGQ